MTKCCSRWASVENGCSRPWHSSDGAPLAGWPPSSSQPAGAALPASGPAPATAEAHTRRRPHLRSGADAVRRMQVTVRLRPCAPWSPCSPAARPAPCCRVGGSAPRCAALLERATPEMPGQLCQRGCRAGWTRRPCLLTCRRRHADICRVPNRAAKRRQKSVSLARRLASAAKTLLHPLDGSIRVLGLEVAPCNGLWFSGRRLPSSPRPQRPPSGAPLKWWHDCNFRRPTSLRSPGGRREDLIRNHPGQRYGA